MKSLAPGYAPCLNAPVFPEITGVSCADARPQGRTQSTKAGKLSSEFIACQNPGRVLTGCASRNAAVNSGSDRSAPGVPPVARRGAARSASKESVSERAADPNASKRSAHAQRDVSEPGQAV